MDAELGGDVLSARLLIGLVALGSASLSACGIFLSTDGYAGDPLDASTTTTTEAGVITLPDGGDAGRTDVPDANATCPSTKDLANCGACGKPCTIANGAGDCSTGTCTVASCASGFGDCDGVAANGCETPTTSSAAACGACSTPCSGNDICAGSCKSPPSDATPTTTGGSCNGNSCACGQSGVCNVTCDQGGCSASAAGSAQLTMSCKAGGCNVTVDSSATVNLDCPGGGCIVTVNKPSGTANVHCAGGNCAVNCSASGGNCTVDHCEAGGCNLQCSANSSCTLLTCTKNCVTTCGGGGTCTNDCHDSGAGCKF